jgi:UDP-GlcNAc:undecaprenyl-phosphate GlcNAc-1-phosphate transferase
MQSLLWLGAIAFALSLLLTPIFRDVFRSYGVVDAPDQGRKIHKYPIPRVGGVAIAFSYVGAFLLVPGHARSVLQGDFGLVLKLAPAAALIFVTGLIDDLIGLKPWQKLLGQLAAAGMAYWAGVRISALFWISTDSWWSLPVTLFWLLACTNAFNLVDGMDGLAGGLGLFSTLTICIAALLHGNPALVLATVPLAGCLLGFLCYNFNPATIFLGDSGSLLIGFMLGCYGVIWSQKSATLLGMTAPLMALSIPLLDTLLAIIRRVLKKQPIFAADRGHMHHKLLDRGLTPRRAALVFYGLSGLVACFSLLQSVVTNNRISGLIVVLFCFVVWIGIQYLGYTEFSIAGKMLFSGEFQRSLKHQLDLNVIEASVRSAQDVESCWRAVTYSADKLGFHCVRMLLDSGQAFVGAPLPVDASTWFLRVPLEGQGYMEFRGSMSNAAHLNSLGAFIHLVHRCIGPQMSRLSAKAAVDSVAAEALAGSLQT